MILKYNYIQINDDVYAYTRQGSGEPLVLFHGFTGSSETWTSFIAKLQKDYDVITIDLPGHGKTVTKPGKTLPMFADDFKQILAVLNMKQIHLLGYSMGGRIALALSLEYPELVKTLMLESASPGIESVFERNARKLADDKLANKISQEGITAFVDYWENIPMFTTQKSLSKETQQAIRQERLRQTENGLSQSLQFMGTGVQPSYWDKLASLSLPVLLIVGELDKKFVELNEKMVSLIKDVEMITVPKAGHAVHLEKSNDFESIVSKFLT